MDPESIGKETIIRVTDWLRGMWEMRRRTGPVQQWVDSIPSPTKSNLPISGEHQEKTSDKPNTSVNQTEPKDIPFSARTKPPSMTVSAPINVPISPIAGTTGLPSSVPHNRLVRDPSLQSDSSHCSSVESLLELRRADPEAILLGLGFGGCSNSPQENGPLSRIPKRFLQPSKLKGIAINDFVRHQQESSESFDSVSLGYRGLTGSPYVAPSEIVQKIMERLREHESHEADTHTTCNYYDQCTPMLSNCTFSVLSPDNRQFLERPRSKSPDMRNKRMIIGQKSFAFGHDGDLIEIKPSDKKPSSKTSLNCNENSAHNSNVSRLFNSTLEKRLPKQLSFDDEIETCENDGLESQTCTSEPEIKISIPDSNVGFKENNASSIANKGEGEGEEGGQEEEEDEEEDTTLRAIADTRRASDGSCEIKCPVNVSASVGRRHSDSIVHIIENTDKKSILLQKRKTLQRQSRITDIDITDDCDSTLHVPNLPKDKKAEPSLREDVHFLRNDSNCQAYQNEVIRTIDKNTEFANESEYCGAKLADTHSQGTHDYVQTVNDAPNEKGRPQQNNKCSTKDKQSQSNENKAGPSCKHDDNGIDCCHPSAKKYWKKMDEIIQENKKLETTVAKNRREMAEIREMLNNVLSVRMEPGF